MEPIAITGIGCRLPGGINSGADLWSKLLAGADLITETPPNRWNIATHFHPNRAAPGRTYACWGGFATNHAEFDAGFFGLTPREASRLDPQQRWLLETAWEALEDAGIPPAKLAGTDAGVYIGIYTSDYMDIQKWGPYEVDVHTTSGSALSIAANRLSYLLDLHGPSLAVDTACSSSLVALDLACQAIWRGDIAHALLGGANVMLGPDVTVSYAKGGFLSPTGRCRTFDAAANGFVRAEGAAVVVLKLLSQALADADRVYAVIHSTLTNQDGRTNGLKVPSALAQEALLREVYRRARIAPEQVGYVEAHGTGTAVGDPIETAALGRALGAGRSPDTRLWIGSVKSNVGHLEAASGVVGLIKLALTLYHRTIPPNLQFKVPNPRIPFADYGLRVPTAVIPWEAAGADGVLYGGVNSFGFGGTNAHAVLSSVAEVSGQGRFARLLPFPYAFHSPCIDACREVFARGIAGLKARRASLPFLSTVTASELTDTLPDADHWWRNLRQPVRFADTVRRAAEMGAKIFLEIGPHPGLVRYVRQVLGDGAEALVLGSLQRNAPGLACLLESTCSLHAFGATIDWKNIIPGPGRHVSFPLYPWQRQTYWTEGHDSRNRRFTRSTHPLLFLRQAGAARCWETCLSTEQFPYLADHSFRDLAVFPATGHIELMLAAVGDGSFGDPLGLTDVNFDRALWADQPHLVQTTYEPNSRRLTVSARLVSESGRGWEIVSRGVRWAVDASGASPVVHGVPQPPADAVLLRAHELYDRFEKAGHAPSSARFAGCG